MAASFISPKYSAQLRIWSCVQTGNAEDWASKPLATFNQQWEYRKKFSWTWCIEKFLYAQHLLHAYNSAYTAWRSTMKSYKKM